MHNQSIRIARSTAIALLLVILSTVTARAITVGEYFSLRYAIAVHNAAALPSMEEHFTREALSVALQASQMWAVWDQPYTGQDMQLLPRPVGPGQAATSTPSHGLQSPQVSPVVQGPANRNASRNLNPPVPRQRIRP